MPLAEVHVTLKPALFDAQGETIKKALHQLGHTDVQSVRIGKFITVELAGDEGAALQGQLDLMCRQLLANPVIEDYEVSVGGADPLAVADATAMPLFDAPPAQNTVPIAAQAAPVVASDTTFDGAARAVSNGAATETDTPGTTSAPAPRLQGAHAEAVTTSRQTETIGGASASIAPGVEAVSTPGGVTDPFQVDFRSYEAMATEAKQSLRILALRKYGNWIETQLKTHGAAWILCLGQQVVEHGPNADTAPTDQHLLKLGIQHDRVPWVFNRPQT